MSITPKQPNPWWGIQNQGISPNSNTPDWGDTIGELQRKYQEYMQRSPYPPAKIRPNPDQKPYLVRWLNPNVGYLLDTYASDEEAMKRANGLMQDPEVLQVQVFQLAALWTRQWTKEEL